MRPSLDDILSHEFFHNGNNIPKLLPTSTLACAPSGTVLKQFMNSQDKPQTSRESEKLNSGALEIDSKVNANTERNLGNDDKMFFNPNRPNTMRESKDDKDKGNKEKDKGMRTLAMSVYNPNMLDSNGGEAVNKGPDVWVRKWVDYSSKYGLGYLLSNGACGVFFNDSTKVIMKPESEVFE